MQITDEKAIKTAEERFSALLRRQLERVERLKEEGSPVDYSELDKLIVGVCGGDGIGPYICASAQKVMEFLLADKIAAGKVEIRQIDGLTIERRVEVMKAIPDDTLAELKDCHVILKGPTTTPKKGDPWPNIESANVAMRKELDLFANVRPVRVPELGIDWTFFRENTEGSYALGSDGFNVTEDLAMDFCVATSQGTERILRAGFEHARKTGAGYVSVVTKANIIKTTDGRFLSIAEKVAEDYPDVKWDDWFIDIMTAKLIDPARRSGVRAPQPLRGHNNRRGRADTGRRRHRGQRQHRQPLRHVRGHPRIGTQDGDGGARPVRGPVQHDQGGRHDDEPHRRDRERAQTGDGTGHMQPVREEARHDRQGGRSHRQRVRRLHNGDRPEGRPRERVEIPRGLRLGVRKEQELIADGNILRPRPGRILCFSLHAGAAGTLHRNMRCEKR
jgi:hypothetical protein